MSELIAQLQHKNNCLAARCENLDRKLVQLRQENDRLRKSEARYRQVVENSPISTSFYSLDGCHIEANSAFERKFGFTVEDSQRVGFNLFTDPGLVENGTLPYMLRALAGETVIEPPTKFYDPSRLYGATTGEYVPGQGHYFPIWNEAGEVQEIIEMSPVITDLLKAQQTILEERELVENQRHRAAQERARLLSTIAQVANLLLRSPDYTTVLPDVVRLLGEAVGSDRCCLTQEIIDPTTQKVAVKFAAEYALSAIPSDLNNPEYQEVGVIDEEPPSELRRRILQGESVNFLVSELPDGFWKSLFEAQQCTSLLIVPIMVSGRCWGSIGFDNCGEPRLFDEAEIAILKVAADSLAAAIERQAKDEALRKSEALYRSLFEISNEGIYRWELDQPVSVNLPVDEQVELVYRHHVFAQGNEALAKMYGFAKAEDIVGMKLADVHLQDSEKTLEMMRAICENGWQIRNAESEEIDVNGQKHYFLNSITSIIENNLVRMGWGTQIDITELREAQQALLQAEQERTRSAAERSHLLTTVTTIANQLLRSPDYTTVLPTVLQLLGEAAHADRCSLVQNITDLHTGQPAVKLHTEWCRAGIQPSIVHTPALETALLWEDFPEFQARLSRNETMSFVVAELAEPARSLMLAQNNITMAMVPIVVGGEFWGVFGFDYCTEARSLDEEETGIYAIAVDSIAAAIERQAKDEALRDSEERLLSEQQQRAAELAKANVALKNSLDRLATEPELDAFLGHVILEIKQQLNAQLAYLFLYNATSHTLNLHLGSEANGMLPKHELQDIDPFLAPIPADISRAWEIMVQEKQPLEFGVWDNAHPENWSHTLEWHRRRGHQTAMCIPLLLGKEGLGFLGLAFTQQSAFTPEEFELAQALAHQATLAIQLTRLAEEAKQVAVSKLNEVIAQEQEKAAQERAVELVKANQSLKRSLSHLAEEPDLDAFLGHVLLEITQQVEACTGHIFLYDAATNTLEVRRSVVDNQAYQGASPTAPDVFRSPFPADVTPAFNYLCQHRTIIFLNTEENSAFWWSETITWHRQRHREAIALALMAGDRPVGLLGLAFQNKSALKPEELELIHALAQQATLAIQLTHLAEQAQQSAILAERNRMAREIHDTLAQGFTGIVVHLEGAENVLTEDPEKARSRLDRARQLARESLAEARRSVHALRPQSLESADLCAAIKQLIQQMTEDTPLHVQFDCEAPPNVLPTEIESNLLRITQEALTNSIKHAAATQVTITLSSTLDTLCLSIHDNGQGFEVQSSNLYKPGSTEGFGLVGMRDRAHSLQGQFDLTSQPGSGTTLQVTVPCPLANWEKSS